MIIKMVLYYLVTRVESVNHLNLVQVHWLPFSQITPNGKREAPVFMIFFSVEGDQVLIKAPQLSICVHNEFKSRIQLDNQQLQV